MSVANTGPVLAPDQVDRLFEPFQRCGAESAGPADGDGGLGLGLSVVRAIADAHGAALTAWTRPGGGLHVEVRFPPSAAARDVLEHLSGPERRW